MSFTFNTGNSIGQVRTLIRDTIEASAFFSDEEINVFLNLALQDVLSASAIALRAIVANKALLEKAVASGDYKEDNRGTSKALIALADAYQATANSIPAEAFYEQNLNVFAYADNLYRRVLRGDEC